jgi:hypothetical protein
MKGDSVNVLEKGRAVMRYRNPYPWTTVRAEARIMRRDVQIKISKTGFFAEHGNHDSHRTEIKGFSFQSKRRLDLVLRNTSDLWQIMVTLTYPNEFLTDGKTVKRHLSAFLQWLRRKRCAYLWVLEFQERGAPHFHVLVKGKDSGGAWLPKDELKREWFNIVGSEDKSHLDQGAFVETIKGEREAAQYVAKMKKHGRALAELFPDSFRGTRAKLQEYLGKDDQKRVPLTYRNCGRFWGCSRLLEKVALMTDGEFSTVKARLMPAIEEYSKNCQAWGFAWEWQGAGFTFVGGADFFREMLRQAVEFDSDSPPWNLYEPPAPKPAFISVEDKLRLEGQYTLDGSIEPTFKPGEFE